MPPLETPETFKLLVDANLSSVHGPDATGCCESIGGELKIPEPVYVLSIPR